MRVSYCVVLRIVRGQQAAGTAFQCDKNAVDAPNAVILDAVVGRNHEVIASWLFRSHRLLPRLHRAELVERAP